MTYLHTMQKRAQLSAKSIMVDDNGAMGVKLSSRQVLNKYLMTGNFAPTFYTTTDMHIDSLHAVLKELDREGDREYIVKAAIFGAKTAKRRDVLAFIVTYLICNSGSEFTGAEDKVNAEIAFKTVVHNGKMLSHVFAMLRTGITGVKSMGSFRRRLFSDWFNEVSDKAIMMASVNNHPTLKDIAMLARPQFKPSRAYRQKVLDFLVGAKLEDTTDLNDEYLRLFALRAQTSGGNKQAFYTTSVAGLPWMAIKDCALTHKQLIEAIVASLSDIEILNSIATLMRMGKTTDHQNHIKRAIVERLHLILTEPKLLAAFASKVEPYRVYQALITLTSTAREIVDVLAKIFEEVLVLNAPVLPDNTVIALDFSGSMANKINDKSQVSCITAAAIYAVGLAIKNPEVTVLLFNTSLYILDVHKELQKITKLALIEGISRGVTGGTNCALPVEWTTIQDTPPDTLIMLSDDESHHARVYDAGGSHFHHFETLKEKNPKARMVCVDMRPKQTQSVLKNPAITRVGGFGTFVFDMIGDVVNSPDGDIEKYLEERILATPTIDTFKFGRGMSPVMSCLE